MVLIRSRFFLIVIVFLFLLIVTRTIFLSHNGDNDHIAVCRAAPPEKAEQCFGNLIFSTLDKKGLGEAFNLLASLYDSTPNFGGYCHGYTHRLGERAYFDFIQKKHIELPKESTYCASGFYHGFMETMVSTTEGTSEAQEFCSYAETLLGGDAKGACYHGIGHGLADGSDPRFWGDPSAMVASALDLCEKTGENEYYVNRCASGVFNSLGIFFNNENHKEFRLKTIPEDPYWICRKQEKEYFALPCYQEMDTVIFRLNNGDLRKSLSYAEKIENSAYAAVAAEALASFSFWGESPFEFDEIKKLEICRGVQNRLRLPCVQGIGAGLVEFGTPGKEYERGISFCQSKMLDEREQDACFSRIMPYIKLLYARDRDTPEDVCQTLDKRFYSYFSCL